jgi:gamma-glutamylcyclotransferase (GGCT)/AIG2-like uncharacterized protein YtfP
MPHCLFAYGTLMFPQVFRHVTGRHAVGRPAELSGYGRYRLHGRSYPGLLRMPGEHVQGMLYEGITAPQLRRLDIFEGRAYRRAKVRVQDVRGRHVIAWTYVIPARHRALLSRRSWDASQFSRRRVQRFLADEP